MNNETPKNDWNDLKSKIKARFGKLTDSSIDAVKGNLDQLSQTIQSTYGYAKEQADKEFNSFKATLHTATQPSTPVSDAAQPQPIAAVAAAPAIKVA